MSGLFGVSKKAEHAMDKEHFYTRLRYKRIKTTSYTANYISSTQKYVVADIMIFR